MLLLLLAACGGGPVGTWMFFREIPQFTGDECATSVSHNFVGAYEPPPAQDDLSWTQDESSVVSEEVSFGRIEQTGDGMVLIVGNEAFPGVDEGKGRYTFTWVGEDADVLEQQHVTGYRFVSNVASATTMRISGTFDRDGFAGAWDVETSTVSTYTESDTWSKEAAAYVGNPGQIPAYSYLLKLDAKGNETAATNDQTAYDCGAAECALTVQDGCSYRYPLTAVPTDLEPDDASWADDAGQPAGL